MIKRLLNSKLPVLAYNPFGSISISYFKKLFKCGCMPVLDTEFMDYEIIIRTIEALEKANILFGIRVYANNHELLDYLKNNCLVNLDIVVVSYFEKDDLNDFKLELPDSKILIETTDIKINDTLKNTECTGLILKGSEAGGKVSQYTSFVLMQWYLNNTDFPVMIHGGAGFYTSAGMFAAGASGVVLDSQLYLTDEAPVSKSFKKIIKGLEEFDSAIVGINTEIRYRFFSKLATKIVKDLKEDECIHAENKNLQKDIYEKIKQNIVPIDTDPENPVQSLFYLGQDASFAKHFVKKSSKLSDVIKNFIENTKSLLNKSEEFNPLKENSKFTKKTGCRYPIIQGPMANISDNADFAAKVYENGGLPFFAMGSLPKDLSQKIILEGSKKVPVFGAGLIGIEALNKSLVHHMDLVKKYKVPFALFAGGIPSQISELEAGGTTAWLHTPSMGMLENAITGGCKGFIFEGTEAGGHVGQLTSLTLWELALNKISDSDKLSIKDSTLIFAGGIATKEASCFISAISSEFSEKGASIAVQLGTPYLFTNEIVETNALKKKYQDVISSEYKTMLMGTSVGLAARTVFSPFSNEIVENENKRIMEKMPLPKRKEAFEHDNIGSLLIAAKGFQPDFESIKKGNGVEYIHFCDEDCYKKGNYCVGDSLAFHSSALDIKAIHELHVNHEDILCKNLNSLEIFSSENQMINDEIAIIGMGCVYPDSKNKEEFWENIISKKYSISRVPDSRMDTSLYYDEDKNAPDKTYTKIAGVIKDFSFDPKKFGMDEKEGRSISRSQQMLLETCSQAMEDAGYPKGKGLNLDSAAVIVGSCLGNELSHSRNLKYFYPEIKYHLDQIDEYKKLPEKDKEKILEALKEKLSGGLNFESPDSATLNIEASKISKWLGAKGSNYVVDGACATSFVALDCAIKELLTGSHDIAVAGGINTSLAPESFIGFCKMGALSANGSYPFDDRSDGFVLGEGCGVFVLKRMKDALRDNDKIHAVIKSVGSSSDGKGKAVAAPSEKGQLLALERCFEKTDRISIEDIDFIEAHGTSTKIGDAAEIGTLKSFYGNKKYPVGVSSVKSQIGHLLGGAGAAGLIKAVMALEKQIIPPNGGFENLSKKFNLDDSSLYIVKEAKKWQKNNNMPRRAAISSYGFGGINYHAVVEEFNENYEVTKRNIFDDFDFNSKRVVVCGVGTVLPGAKDTNAFWEKLVSGQKDFTSLPKERLHNEYYADAEEEYRLPNVKAGIVQDYEFNCLKYRMPPKTLGAIDKAQLFALDACSQAIDQAFENSENRFFDHGNKTGIILGTISGEKHVENILRSRTVLLEKIIKETKSLDESVKEKISTELGVALRKRCHENCEDTTPGLLSNIVSGRAANFFGANGANFVVDAACASSGIAMDLSVKALETGDLDAVLAGGIDANFYPGLMMVFKRLGLLSDDDTKIFDKRAKGVNLSEGGVVLFMTTLEKAKENNLPVLAEISGCAFRSCAARNLYAPSQELLNKTAGLCYDKTQITKNNASHLDVFGFSSLMMDKIESQAFEQVFEKDISFGSIKPEFGYFKGANPAVVAAKLVLMAKNKTLLPNRSFDSANSIISENSNLKPLESIKELDKKSGFHLSASMFGFGANHGHMIVSSLPLWIEKQLGNDIFDESQEVIEINKAPDFEIPEPIEGCTALLCGQGSQYPHMMKELYNKSQVIKDVMDRAEKIFKEKRGESLLKLMFEKDSRLNSTENTQPAVFTASAALFEYAKTKGYFPKYFIGHSIGEYSALYCCGMLDFDDAMNLVLTRSKLMKEADEKYRGRILVLFKNSDDALSLIKDFGIEGIYIANINSRKQTAVSGLEKNINEFCSFLSEKSIMYKKLDLTGAFHTPILLEASKKLSEYIKNIKFNDTDFTRIISNLTGKPYPQDEKKVKELLINQIVSPVQFIKSIETAFEMGTSKFLEIGTGKILTGLLKNMDLGDYTCLPCVDKKKDDFESLETIDENIEVMKKQPVKNISTNNYTPKLQDEKIIEYEDADDFNLFLEKNDKRVKDLLYKEFLKASREKKLREVESFGFYTGPVAVAGVAIGLPGGARKVFEKDNFKRILSGHNCIDPLSDIEKELLLDKKITRISKSPDGKIETSKITKTDDVIQLAGKLGYFDISDYGVSYDYDIAISLGIAAGIEALKDAKIPLVKRKPKKAGYPVKGFELPFEMQANTGVIMTSLFAGMEKFVKEINSYYFDKFYSKPYEELENIYYHLMEKLDDKKAKDEITDWFFNIRKQRKEKGEYQFDKNLILNITPLGSAHFAQHIKAKGPNINMSGACASTTQACAVAEDWIRNGRCERVIVIGGEAAGKKEINQWIGSGFLSLGAASVKKNVNEAAKPFDMERHGTILGSGGVSLVIERRDTIKKRGLNGQAEVLGTYLGNSAYHSTNIDKQHLADEMKSFVERMESRHGISKDEFAKHTVFMSHETYTPAKGGSADAEVNALRAAFGKNAGNVKIVNTKGFTGHTLGAAIEDAVMVKGLQNNMFPMIPNLENIPPEFADLRLNDNKKADYQYGLHFSAGFGSHFAFMFVKKLNEADTKNNKVYEDWLKSVSGQNSPKLVDINNTLCIEPGKEEKPVKAPKKTAVSAASASSGADLTKKITLIIADQTGYTEDMLESDLDLEADLGIDTVKQVEIFGKVSAEFGLEVPEDLSLRDLNTIEKLSSYIGKNSLAPQSTQINNLSADFESEIKKIIAEQTGYTEDMLEPDLDLEADLGIDTVKQVEIFGKISSEFGIEVPEDLNLRDLSTIKSLSLYIEKEKGEAPVAAEVSVNKPVEKPSSSDSGDLIEKRLKAVIAEQTGYTEDMLEPGLDLEADLGIDTVKQVEIFGKVSAEFDLDISEDLLLGGLNTIEKLVNYIKSETGDVNLASEVKTDTESHPSEGSDTEKILKAVISEQTGYTEDMLEPDLDLEADLGIDTVKQVEIFGKVSAEFDLEISEDLLLGGLNTIAKLTEYINSQKGHVKKEAQPVFSAGGKKEEIKHKEVKSRVKRYIPHVKNISFETDKTNIFENNTFLVTCDDFGFADKVISKIKENKGRVISLGENKKNDYKCSFADHEGLVKTIEKIGNDNKINGFIHLYPVNDYFKEDNEIEKSIKPFFLITKGLIKDLDSKNSLISSISFNSVVYPYAENENKIAPVFAGISGMAKTINKELYHTIVKIADFKTKDPKKDMSFIVDSYIAHLMSPDMAVETGIDKNGFFGVSMKPEKTDISKKSFVDKNSTILVTGGARGITFEILKQLADEYEPRLIILGRSDIESIDDRFKKNDMDETSIIQILKKEMKGKKPLEIKKAAQRIVRYKGSLENINKLRGLGIKAEYHPCDVTDYESVKSIVKKYKKIDGVIHAAGLEESQIISKKELSSFNRVFDTKVKGAKNLIKAFEKRDVKFFIGFSSVTARFGNESQIDYTGANDMLGKMFYEQSINHPKRVYKIMSWTAWKGAGMATNETVQKVLESRGLTFLPLNEGVKFFMDELHDSKNIEAVFTGPDKNFDKDMIMDDEISPFLDEVKEKKETGLCFSRVLDLKKDLFLMDHAMKDVPVFLGATGIETMAEAASYYLGTKDNKLCSVTNFSIPYGIKILKQRPKALEIEAYAPPNTGSKSLECRIYSRFQTAKITGDRKLHYKGKFHFADNAPEAKKIELPKFTPVKIKHDLDKLVYHPERLFMDGSFRTIRDIASFDNDILITRVAHNNEREFFKGKTRPEFLTDVIMVDAMFQTGGLYEFMTSSELVLPYEIERFDFIKPVKRKDTYLCLTRKTASDDKTNTYDLWLTDDKGNVFMQVKNFKMVKLAKLGKDKRIDNLFQISA